MNPMFAFAEDHVSLISCPLVSNMKANILIYV